MNALNRFTRYCIVGTTGILVDTGLLFLLADPAAMGLNLIASKLIAVEISIIHNFFWNDIWTFRDCTIGERQPCQQGIRFAKFNLICLVGMGLNVGLLAFQVNTLQMNVYLSNIIAIVIVSLWNYGLNSRFGWGNSG